MSSLIIDRTVDLSDRVLLPITISSPKILELIEEGCDLKSNTFTDRDREKYYDLLCNRIGKLLVIYQLKRRHENEEEEK